MKDPSAFVSTYSEAGGALDSRRDKLMREQRASFGPVRRLIVASALATCDLTAAGVGTRMAETLIYRFAAPEHTAVSLPAALLVAVHLSLGLYCGTGPSPYERFRLRGLGALAFVAMNLLVAISIETDARTLSAVAFSGVFLLVLGHYFEIVTREALIRRGLWGARTALVGWSGAITKLAQQLTNSPELGLRPVGFLSSGEETRESAFYSAPCLGRIDDSAHVAQHAEVLIFASRSHLATYEASARTYSAFTKVLLAEEAQDAQSLWLSTRTLGGAVGLEIPQGLHLARNLRIKRVIDLMIAVPASLLALPLIGALALAIKAVDHGPAFYGQNRVGLDGRSIRVFKLRTMFRDAECRLEEHLNQNAEARAEWQRFFKLTNDPRILPVVGAFIRRTSLDELPQFWNILSGDMSLVGPRPFPGYHMGSFDREFQTVRASVKPGLTGLWQVSARSDGDLELQKGADLFYIRNWSIWLDLYIILQTLPAVLSARGAR